MKAVNVLKIVTNGTSKQTTALVDAGAIPVLVKMLRLNIYHQDGKEWSVEIERMRDIIRDDAIVALENLAGKDHELRGLIISLGGLDQLLKLMKDPRYLSCSTVEKCEYTLSNLCKSENTPLEKTQVEAMLPAINALASDFYPDVSAFTACILSMTLPAIG